MNKLLEFSPGSEVTEEDHLKMKKIMASIYYLNETEI